MGIPFQNIPQNWRLPLFFAEVSNADANTATRNQVTLIVGQMTSAGSATPNVPIISPGPSGAIGLFGQGSMLARMAATYDLNDTTGEVWFLPVSDAGGSVAAVGTFNFTSAATANGTLHLYIAGRLVVMTISSAQTVNQLATALAAAINAIPNMPVTAAVDGSTLSKVDLTAVNAGPIGNDFDIRTNYLGAQQGEVDPAGLAYTIVAMSTGATPPVFTTALANCQDQPFDFIVFPYTDATSLNAMKAFLSDSAGRWSFDVQVYGHAMAALRGTYGALVTAGTARNDQHMSIVGFYGSPTPCDEWAAAFYGASAVSLRADPGVPLQTLQVNGVLAPPLASQFPASERNTLLYDGISTFTVQSDGTVAIENMITTYQLNSFNQPDNSYLEIETMFLLMFVLRALATLITSKYARVKLAADGTRFAAGSNIVTPTMIKLDIIQLYMQLEFQGYVQDSVSFAKNVIVQINANNPNRLDCLWPGTLIGQLRMFALLAQFRLEAAQGN